VDGRLTGWTERLGGPAALGERLSELLRLGTAPRE
jgi:hypothetical protein